MSLQDAYGRTIDYLRISLTDKCNLRCRYCMPAEGISRLRQEDVLTLEEILRVSRILTEMGICRIRLTGGEPLVRRGIVGLMQSLSRLPAKPKIAMTTNGTLLAERLEELREAGLESVNISLDTKDPDTFRELTGMDAFDKVERSIDLAYKMGLPVKLNCVPLKGINENGLTELAEYAWLRKIDVRFIELMPMGCAKAFRGISEAEILEKLAARFGAAEPLHVMKNSVKVVSGIPGEGTGREESGESAALDPKDLGPAKYVHFHGFQGRIGFISPLSHAFCSECNRLRLTVEGKLKLCLYYPDGLDVRAIMRAGCTDEELRTAIQGIIKQKPERHEFCETKGARERRGMYEIGG